MTRAARARGDGRSILLTGFEAFADHGRNPSADLVKALDGERIAGLPVVARVLPVSIARLRMAIETALAEAEPALVLALGLASGEPVIRLERVALNLAAFSAPDNDGRLVASRPIDPKGPDGLFARLDLEACRAALLAAGIPARLSESAGTYLCNAAMYRLLRATPNRIPCGFIHVPDTPEGAARGLRRGGASGGARASMELATMIRAVSLVAETQLRKARRSGR
jgi:pyroglutamyl-peptidase